MNFLYKAAVIWVLSLLAAGPIPLAVHVAICHHDEHSSHCHHHESASCSHHDHASHSEDCDLALVAGEHDHECSVCQTLSQTASSNTLGQVTLSQPLTIQTLVVVDGVHDAPTTCGYLVRGPPC